MRRSSSLDFVIGATLSAAIAAVALGSGMRGATTEASGWAAVGFVAMALSLIATGAWLAHEHGRAGAAFVVALGTGIVMRAAFVFAVVAGAAHRGDAAVIGALTGLAGGFVPVTGFEIVWFSRRAYRVAPQTGRRG